MHAFVLSLGVSLFSLFPSLPTPSASCRINTVLTTLQLAADADPGVKNGAELLDRLVKDIVTESPTFDIQKFIPLLTERIYAVNPHTRQVCACACACDAIFRAGVGE